MAHQIQTTQRVTAIFKMVRNATAVPACINSEFCMKIYVPIFLALMTADCSVTKTSQVITTNEGAQLTKNQIHEMEVLAENGDEAAAQKLITHYQYWSTDAVALAKWYGVSSSHGNLRSKCHLAAMLSWGEEGYEATKESCKAGIILLKECIAEGGVIHPQDAVTAEKTCNP